MYVCVCVCDERERERERRSKRCIYTCTGVSKGKRVNRVTELNYTAQEATQVSLQQYKEGKRSCGYYSTKITVCSKRREGEEMGVDQLTSLHLSLPSPLLHQHSLQRVMNGLTHYPIS